MVTAVPQCADLGSVAALWVVDAVVTSIRVSALQRVKRFKKAITCTYDG